MEYHKEVENVTYSGARTAMHVRISWLAFAIKLEEVYLIFLFLSKTCGPYLVTQHNRELQSSLNDLEHTSQDNPDFFFPLVGTKATSF